MMMLLPGVHVVFKDQEEPGVKPPTLQFVDLPQPAQPPQDETKGLFEI